MKNIVVLRENLRYYEADDSDFFIDAGQEKEIANKHLRSYSIKYHIFRGNLKLKEGELNLHIKNAKVLFSSELNPFCYGFEDEKFFKKHLETEEVSWLEKVDLPEGIYEKLTGEKDESKEGDNKETEKDSEESEKDSE